MRCGLERMVACEYSNVMQSPATVRWLAALADFCPAFLRSHPILAGFSETAGVALHGSTSFGIDDAVSDLDLWLVLTPAELRRLDAISSTRFFEFELNAKPGHFSAVDAESFIQRVRQCDMPLISELRNACSIADPGDLVRPLIGSASLPMPQDVRRAFFQYHYVEFRGDDRAADHPLDRNDPVAVLQAHMAALAHALRAAMVLDGLPYPYSKWLYRQAVAAPTGQKLAAKVQELIDLVGSGALRDPAGSDSHPLSGKMKQIRLVLIESAQEAGIDQPWLKQWWLHIDAARAGILRVQWPCE
jgi:hypothetical protein